MTYHDEPHYECDRCGDTTSDLDDSWLEEWYDNHYCPICAKKIEEEEQKEIQYREDIESGKITVKEQKLIPIPKWCPKVTGLLLKCRKCWRMPNDCPYPDKGGH